MTLMETAVLKDLGRFSWRPESTAMGNRARTSELEHISILSGKFHTILNLFLIEFAAVNSVVFQNQLPWCVCVCWVTFILRSGLWRGQSMTDSVRPCFILSRCFDCIDRVFGIVDAKKWSNCLSDAFQVVFTKHSGYKCYSIYLNNYNLMLYSFLSRFWENFFWASIQFNVYL